MWTLCRNALTVEEGYKLISGPLGSKSKGNRGKAMYGVQSEDHIVVLESYQLG